MDINQIFYLISIVEANFNITAAAEKIHISQPALSKFIKKLETELNIRLFIRQNGRFVGLTNAGEIIYQSALKMQAEYNEMIRRVSELSEYYAGSVRIGIPPLILSTLFTRLMPELITLNPNIQFKIIERGDLELQSLIQAGKLDFAVVLHPNTLNNKLFHERVIYRDRLSVFMNEDHPLRFKEEPYSWNDLDQIDFVIASSNFQIRDDILQKFHDYQISPNIIMESISSEYIIEVLKCRDLITILPNPLKNIVNMDGVYVGDFEDQIPWSVSLVSPIKEVYSPIDQYIVNTIANYFEDGGQIKNIERMLLE